MYGAGVFTDRERGGGPGGLRGTAHPTCRSRGERAGVRLHGGRASGSPPLEATASVRRLPSCGSKTYRLTLCLAVSIIRGMNRLPLADRVRILAALVEGNSSRGTARMVGVDKKTVLKLLADVGDA